MNNKNKFTTSRANPPFKGGRGDFLNLKTIMNNKSNLTTSRSKPLLRGGIFLLNTH